MVKPAWILGMQDVMQFSDAFQSDNRLFVSHLVAFGFREFHAASDSLLNRQYAHFNKLSRTKFCRLSQQLLNMDAANSSKVAFAFNHFYKHHRHRLICWFCVIIGNSAALSLTNQLLVSHI